MEDKRVSIFNKYGDVSIVNTKYLQFATSDIDGDKYIIGLFFTHGDRLEIELTSKEECNALLYILT